MKSKIVEAASPEKFQGWSKLEPTEQSKLTVETQALDKAADNLEMSNLEIGEHLDNINRILAPKRQFNKWLVWWLSQRKKSKSRSWAYEAMEEFKTIRSHMPKHVLEMAKERGTKIDLKVLALKPPPETKDKGEIAAYLDTVRPIRGRIDVAKSPDLLLKECVNFVSTRWAQLPQNHKTRTAFMRSLIGMLLGRFGVANEQSFAPMAVPDNFRAQRGRPKAA